MASTIGAAIYYAQEKGWPVIPVWPADFDDEGAVTCRCGNQECRSIGKHPINKYGGKPIAPRGVLDATTDRRIISYWWSLVPDANIGVRGDKFFALDVDDMDALFDLTSANGRLPDTIESISGSGGTHILFSQPEGLVFGNEEGNLPRGINVRGNRGYIIVPPSNHKSGQRYEWEVSSHPRDVELAEAPDWLVKMIQAGRHEEVDLGEIVVADSAPDVDKLAIHPSMKELIKTAPVDGEDRSSSDQRAIVALLSVGCTPEQIKDQITTAIRKTGGKGHILGGGCDIAPGTPADNIRIWETVVANFELN